MISSTRQTEPLTLAKVNKLLYRPLAIDSMMSADGFDQYINGQDFKLTQEGNIEWVGSDDMLGKPVVLTYQR